MTHWHQWEHHVSHHTDTSENTMCHDTLTPMRTPCVTTHWHQQEHVTTHRHQWEDHVLTHWHQWEDHVSQHADTSENTMCHNTLTPVRRPCVTTHWHQWEDHVSQHTDTSEKTMCHNTLTPVRTPCVTTHWHQWEHWGYTKMFSVFTKTHSTESRFVTGPESILVCMRGHALQFSNTFKLRTSRTEIGHLKITVSNSVKTV